MFRLILMTVFLVAGTGTARARTWHLAPDGTGDAPTIQAAIDSAVAGDTVELACGTYVERAITPISGITIRSASGDPDCVTIDGGNQPFYGSVFQCWGLDVTTIIAGLTITGGLAIDNYTGIAGGGMVVAASDVVVVRCRFTGNRAKTGGAISVHTDSHPTFVECEITGNRGDFANGALRQMSGSLRAIRCRIDGNTAGGEPREGTIRAGTAARFECCDLDRTAWSFAGDVTFADADCGPVAVVRHTWGSLKALYRP